MKHFVLLFVLSVLSWASHGQKKEQVLGLEIVRVEKEGNGYKLFLNHGEDYGLKPGISAEIWNMPGAGAGAVAIGNGSIEKAEFSSAVILFSGEAMPMEGSLAFVTCLLPRPIFGVYSFCAIYNIQLVKASGQPYFTIDEIVQQDGKEFQHNHLETMLKEAHEMGRNLQAANDKRKVKFGSDQGMLLSEAIQQSDTLDVWYFLLDLAQGYVKNMGKEVSFTSDFAQYVWQGDDISVLHFERVMMFTKTEKYQKMLEGFSHKFTEEQINDWNKAARNYFNKGKDDDAHKMLDGAIAAGEYVKKPGWTAWSFFYKGSFRQDRELYAEAIDPYKKAVETMRLIKDDRGMGYALYNIGRCYANLNEYGKAVDFFTQAIELRKKIHQSSEKSEENAKQLFYSYTNCASAYKGTDDFSLAKKMYESAFELTVNENMKDLQASALWDIALIEDNNFKNFEKAEENFLKAASLYLEIKDTASAVTNFKNAGIMKERTSDWAGALVKAEEAFHYAQQWGNPATLAYALDYLAKSRKGAKKYKEAVQSYLDLEKLYASMGNKEKHFETVKETAMAYRDWKQYANAVKKYEERLTFLNPDQLSAKGETYWDIAYTYNNARDLKNTASNYNKSIELYTAAKDTSNLNTVLNNLAIAYRENKDSVNALKFHRKAFDLVKNHPDKKLLTYTLDRIGGTYGEFEMWKQQLDYYHRELAIYQQLKDYGMQGEVCESIASTYKKMREPCLAAEWYKNSIEYYALNKDLKNEASSYWDYAFYLGECTRHKESIGIYEVAFKKFIQVPDSANASIMLSNIGQTYWTIRNMEKAMEYHRQSIAMAVKIKDKKQEAYSWSKLAILYQETTNPVKSNEAFRNALAALETVNDSTELSSTFNQIANGYSTTKDYSNSSLYFNKAIDIRKAQKDTSNWAGSVNDRSNMFTNKGELKKGEEDAKFALSLYRKIKNKDGQVYALMNLGYVNTWGFNNYVVADKFYQEAIGIARQIKNGSLEASCYKSLSSLYRSQGKASQADESLQKAMKLYQQNKRWVNAVYTLLDIARDANYVYGDARKSLKYYDEAQAMADTLNDRNLMAYVYSGRSAVMREMGSFAEAHQLADQSMELYRQNYNDWGLAGSFIDKGNIYKLQSEFEKAITAQLKADSIYQSIGQEYPRLAPMANLGEVYVAEGDYTKGLDYYLKSNAIMKKAGDLNENLGIIQGCIGEAYYYLNNFPEADRWLQESIRTCEITKANRPKAGNLSVLGRLKIEEKKYDEAARYLAEGIKLSKETGLNIAYMSNMMLMGRLEVERNNLAKAKLILNETVILCRKIGSNANLWESLYYLGLASKNSGDLVKAKEYLKESIAVIEIIRNKVVGGDEARKLFSSDKTILKVYDALIDVLLKLGETEEGMAYLQKNNEDNLKEKFKGIDVKFESEEKNKIISQERDMKAKLDGVDNQLSQEKMLPTEKQNLQKIRNLEGVKSIAEKDYLTFVNQQVNIQPELSKFFNNSIQPAVLKGKKKQIPKDMALVSYLPGEKQLYIFAATSDTVIARVIPVSSDELKRKISMMLNVIKTSLGSFGALDAQTLEAEKMEFVGQSIQKDEMMRPFEEIYQYLIAPVHDIISSKSRLGIIPTGALNYIPFQMLGKTLKNGKLSLLANQFAIFYTNSTDMLFRSVDDESKKLKILAFGNPDSSLPSTEREVIDIKKLYPDATIYVRHEATEDRAKYAGEEFNVIHFATHGNLDYEDFSKSYLTMANNPGSEDGQLTLEELWGMEVMNHLNIVVLSACQTAVTKGSNENSPVSPASGFLQNGVKSVIATLWKVDDEATSLLMGEFYKSIKTMDTVDAIRAAQVSLSKHPKFSHPYYWAAVVLMGDWR